MQKNKIDFKELAQKFGTPLYVYDQGLIEENYKKLHKAFSNEYANVHIHYAIKANSNPHIIKTLKDLGAGADCSSPGELHLAKIAGVSPEDIIYTGNYESEDDLRAAVSSKCILNLDDEPAFDRLVRLNIGLPTRLSFRVNPGIGRGGFEGITTGGVKAKFGIPFERAVHAYKKAANAGVKELGLHMMTGSNNLEPSYFAEIVERLMNIAGPLFKEIGRTPAYIDIGGGLGVPYYNDEGPLDIEATAKLICDVFKSKCAEFGWKDTKLMLEPGRYLVAESGYLLSKVLGVKESYESFIGIDAGMHTLLRPALYDAYHKFELIKTNEASANGNPSATRPVNICGQICENTDIFIKNIDFPAASENDLVIIYNAGAYGMAMSSQYNGRPRSAEVLIQKNGQYKLIRERETLEDLSNKITPLC